MSAEPIAQAAPQPVPETVIADKTPELTTAAAETTPAEQPADKPTEIAAEQPAETATEKPADTVPANTAANGTAAATDNAPPVPSKEPVTKQPEAPAKPEFLTKNPALSQLFDSLPKVLEKTGHKEMWGVPLKDFHDPPTANVLIKFLRANEGNAKQAEEQLTKALEWRKKLNPLELAANATFSKKKFDGLGYITSYTDPKYGKVIFTWNIYGAVKDINATFGDVDEFIKWRTTLMELAVQQLHLGDATQVIDYNGEDPYQMLQVHDYQNVSFLRMNPSIRAASKQTIDTFSIAYPELLREKFFINVPVIMGWMFTALKVFLSKNTIRKFHPITNGANLAREFSYADEIPKAYGGKGAELKDVAETVPLEEDVPATEPVKNVAEQEPAKEVTKEEAKEEPVKTEEPAPVDTPKEVVAPVAPAAAAAPAAAEAAVVPAAAAAPDATVAPATADAPVAPATTAAETKEEQAKEEAPVEPVAEEPATTEAATATAAPVVAETQ